LARIDKYDPISGGHRAPLAANVNAHDGVIGGGTAPVGVGLDSSGRVVVGVSVAAVGIIGVLCLPSNKKAGDVVDVMTAGEIVDVGGTAGTVYTANTTTGAITNAAASATQIRVGYTVEAGRLVVRV
jgi:hypothetical protein